MTILDRARRLFGQGRDDAEMQEQLARLRKKAPLPVLWLFGKTQTGKTSIIRYLTQADDAEIGRGFRPCTAFSREYQFPTTEAPLLTFLDTRGVDEPTYDPDHDLRLFNDRAHLIIVTVKALDHAQENVLKHLQSIRNSQPQRPILLVMTCLHEAYPQQQHSVDASAWQPSQNGSPGSESSDLARSLNAQRRRFDGLVNDAVAVDLTRPEEGFHDPNYGGPLMKEKLIELLPSAYRQTLITLDQSTAEIQDLFAKRALPHIVAYSTLAATAGAYPVPWIDLVLLPGIQTRMIYHLAQLYGQPLSAARFLELVGTLGVGMAFRQALREFIKFIPIVGSVAAGALAGASTFALGKAFCFYYRGVHQGHIPDAAELKRYYHEQLTLAAGRWHVAPKGSPS